MHLIILQIFKCYKRIMINSYGQYDFENMSQDFYFDILV